jgi:hypothetical protein
MVLEVLLTSLAVLEAAAIPSSPSFPRQLVASFSGRESGSSNGGFRTDCAAAHKAGFITYPRRGEIRLTERGREHIAVTVLKPPRSNQDIVDYLLKTTFRDKRTQTLLVLLSDGTEHTRDEVARALQFNGPKVRTAGDNSLSRRIRPPLIVKSSRVP